MAQKLFQPKTKMTILLDKLYLPVIVREGEQSYVYFFKVQEQ